MAESSMILNRPASATNRPTFMLNAAYSSEPNGICTNDLNNNTKAIRKGQQLQYVQAVPFKYQQNLAKEDIDEMRRLLTLGRANLSVDEREFYKCDYERLMEDDWLMTRFLLRGIKSTTTAHLRPSQSKENADTTTPIALSHRQHHDLLANDSQSSLADSRREDVDLDEQSIYYKTMELIRNCAKFRFEYQISSKTNLREFPLDWTSTNGLFNYMPDLKGNPTVFLRVCLHRPKLIDSEEARFQFKRYMLYTLEQADQDLYNQIGKAICCVFDMTNVSLDNIDLELTNWMIRSFKDCGPKLVCYVVVYNPPWFFTATFKLISSTLLSSNKKQCVKFVYGDKILDFIDDANLPPYLKASLAR